MSTEERRQIMNELFNAEYKVEKHFKHLEANLKFYDAEIKAKVKRIEELKAENNLLKSRIEELEGGKQC